MHGPTHEIHKIKCPTNKNVLTVYVTSTVNWTTNVWSEFEPLKKLP